MALHQALFKEKQTIVVTAKTLRQASFLFKKILIYLRDVRSVKFEVKIVGTEEQTKLTLYLENGSQILCLPGSPDTIRGVSAVDLLLVDEAAMCSDDLFQALTPMLAVSGGRMILLSTPNGKMGFFYEIWSRWLEQGEKSGWTGITLRASENPRISPDFLRLERETKSPIRYRTEYECEFLDTEEQLISTEMIDALKNSDVPILNL
jgi:phage FluMu gp28-like protein